MVKNLLVYGVLVVGLLTMPNVARAGDFDADPEACATNLLDCYTSAAKIDNFWYRWAAGIDCEFKFTKCSRQMLIGN